MNKNCLALLLAPALVLHGQGRATTLPEALTAHLKNAPLLHLTFTQTRTLAALSRPLKSSGSLVVSRDHGVLWQVSKPLTLTVVVGLKGVMEVDRDGKKKIQSSKDVPMVAQMGRIMKSLLEGRWSALDDFFTVQAEGTPAKWAINLAPRPQTAAFIRSVKVSGAKYIERIHVEEPSGDHLDLTFEHPREDLPLTSAERQLFSFE